MRRYFPLFWLVVLFLVAAFVATAEASSRFEIKQMVMSEAANSRVPVSLALAVAKVESDFNAKALSSAGARGVMQIMPATARDEFGVHPQKLWNPETNIRLGIQFLEKLHSQYDGRWELALSLMSPLGCRTIAKSHNRVLKDTSWRRQKSKSATMSRAQMSICSG